MVKPGMPAWLEEQTVIAWNPKLAQSSSRNAASSRLFAVTL